MNGNTGKTLIKRTFFVFSVIFFLIILLGGTAVFFFAMRRIGNDRMERELSLAVEAIRLRIANAVNTELGLAVKMADVPLIKRHLRDPENPRLRELAFEEIAAYRRNFKNNSVFWISDTDKRFYFDDAAFYVLDPDDPESYWYNMTLYETSLYNFNINYNAEMEQTNLWVNAPVFDGGVPIGMVGTGIDLTGFISFMYQELDNDIEFYLFNALDEITVARDQTLAFVKKNIALHLGPPGEAALDMFKRLHTDDIQIITHENTKYALGSIPILNWYIVTFMPINAATLFDTSLAAIFFGSILLALIIFIVSNGVVAFIQATVDEQTRQLVELKEAAEAASRTKSNFLANMSHEIRTPMNAITGMSELLLRGELPDESRDYANNIRQASANLLSIINDLLDFSKIEAGRLEIFPVKYMLSSLVNDTVSIIRMRLMDKPIRFFTNIDSRLPNDLVGDEVRMRQILLNLLGNAVKYTERGFISMSITGEKREGDRIRLKIAIADSGFGIKEEDLGRLFGEFIQVDTKRNKGIEGTGLGLAITKRLCAAMGGDISVESGYGRGSTFTAIIPQTVGSDLPFALVDKPEEKKVLVYERRDTYANSVCWSLENMGIRHTLATDQDAFAAALKEGDWYYVFSGYGLYEQIQPVLAGLAKRPPLALMVEWGTEAYVPRARFVSLPVQSLSIADILNGAPDRKGYVEGGAVFAGTRFIAPSARLLVVDDIATNLKVAEGLLIPYRVKVDTCLSGAEAVDLVKQRDYDIVFMDHMMPGMDGMEAAALIRAWEKEKVSSAAEAPGPIPVIALTANAVSGMKEMFLARGFSDFLAKPIDVSRLDEIMGRWIPQKKREKAEARAGGRGNEGSGLSIPGVDTARGMTMTGGTASGYKQVLALFRKDAEDRLALLQRPPGEAGLPAFITQVHALKSASGTLGAAEISAGAARLEAAGKAGDLDVIREELPGFAAALAELTENIRAALNVSGEQAAAPGSSDTSSHISLFRELAGALAAQKIEAVDRIMEELDRNVTDPRTREILEAISDDVLMAEFEKALEAVKNLTAGAGAE